MKSEELLEYARKHYPIGTRYYTLTVYRYERTLTEVTEEPKFINDDSKEETNLVAAGYGYIYCDRLGWAERHLTDLERALEIIYRDDE